MQYEAVLFDFDGTLADSFPAITDSTNHVRAQYGLPPLSEATVRDFVGLGLTNLLERLVPGAPPADAVAHYRAHHGSVMLAGTRLFPGVPETLQALRAQGRKLAVCSNKSVHFTRGLVQQLGLAELFPIVLGPEDVAAPKPDPAMLLEALRLLKVSPSRALYIGDMTIDTRTAHAAGMPCWIMPGGPGTHDIAPDLYLNDFPHILQTLHQIDPLTP
jgi:2-phosphoglycolate phosphatase